MTTYAPLTILGAGSWGTALALHLSRLGQTIQLWTIETDHVPIMLTEKTNNRYLPGFPFPATLTPTADLLTALSSSRDILLAVPSGGFRETLIKIKPLLRPEQRILWATKGFDHATGQLLHQVTEEIIGRTFPYAALSGPSFAREVAAGLPTAVVIASQNTEFAQDLSERFSSLRFRIILSTDIMGVEIGGAVKNVLAIATGISDGMGLGSNARSALITRGLAEITQLGVALGAQAETFMGLSGLGDLILTCSDDQSRNRRFGLALAKGKNVSETEREIGQVIEGKRAAELTIQQARKLGIKIPIIEAVWEILEGKLSIEKATQNFF